MPRTMLFLAAALLAGAALAQTGDVSPRVPEAPANSELRWSASELQWRKSPGTYMLRLERKGDTMQHSIDPDNPAMAGLLDALRGNQGARPVRFTLDREAGRLDCAGSAGRDKGSGTCDFTPSREFASALARRGIRLEGDKDAFALTMVDAHVALVDDLQRLGVPVRTTEELAGLSALEVSARWVEGLIAAGRKPPTVETLLAFKALGIDPDYVRGMAAAGYGDVSDEKLLEFKALDITPGYLRAMNGKAAAHSVLEAGAIE